MLSASPAVLTARGKRIEVRHWAGPWPIDERWWDPEGEFKPLHAINPLRLDFIDARVGLAGREVPVAATGNPRQRRRRRRRRSA